MSADQASAIIALADKVRYHHDDEVDLEMAQLIQHLFGHKPSALYHLVQQNLALQAQLTLSIQQNIELQQALQSQLDATPSRSWLTWLERKQVDSSDKNTSNKPKLW